MRAAGDLRDPPNSWTHAALVALNRIRSLLVTIALGRSAKLRCGGSIPPGASRYFTHPPQASSHPPTPSLPGQASVPKDAPLPVGTRPPRLRRDGVFAHRTRPPRLRRDGVFAHRTRPPQPRKDASLPDLVERGTSINFSPLVNFLQQSLTVNALVFLSQNSCRSPLRPDAKSSGTPT
jgi:hypothetical protein